MLLCMYVWHALRKSCLRMPSKDLGAQHCMRPRQGVQEVASKSYSGACKLCMLA